MIAGDDLCVQKLRKVCLVDLEAGEETALLSIYQEVRFSWVHGSNARLRHSLTIMRHDLIISSLQILYRKQDLLYNILLKQMTRPVAMIAEKGLAESQASVDASL